MQKRGPRPISTVNRIHRFHRFIPASGAEWKTWDPGPTKLLLKWIGSSAITTSSSPPALNAQPRSPVHPIRLPPNEWIVIPVLTWNEVQCPPSCWTPWDPLELRDSSMSCPAKPPCPWALSVLLIGIVYCRFGSLMMSKSRTKILCMKLYKAIRHSYISFLRNKTLWGLVHAVMTWPGFCSSGWIDQMLFSLAGLDSLFGSTSNPYPDTRTNFAKYVKILVALCIEECHFIIIRILFSIFWRYHCQIWRLLVGFNLCSHCIGRLKN